MSSGSGAATSALPGIYVHVPFCSWICPYCDFAVLRGNGARRAAFVEALIQEIALWAGHLDRVDTVYFGGGTPSILDEQALERILTALGEQFDLAGSRVFLEANPEDVTVEAVDGWRRQGISMLSLGVQSFADPELAFLGRRHTAVQAEQAAEAALAAGFDWVSFDLIYGLPEQSSADWRRTLERAVALTPEHLSCYQLTVHEKTVFGVRRQRGELTELPAETQAELFFATHERLAAAGFDGYEVSNFARRRRHRSAHNQKYWRHVPYLGLGPSAHSYDGAARWWNERSEGRWRRRVQAGERPVADEETLSARQLVLERLLLGFRTSDGLDLDEVERLSGVDLTRANRELIEAEVSSGRLELEGSRLLPTLAGMATADSLAAAFVLP